MNLYGLINNFLIIFRKIDIFSDRPSNRHNSLPSFASAEISPKDRHASIRFQLDYFRIGWLY